MLNLFKKNKTTGNKSKMSTSTAGKDCDGDPDCPMCHVSNEVVEQLKGSESDSSSNK